MAPARSKANVKARKAASTILFFGKFTMVDPLLAGGS